CGVGDGDDERLVEVVGQRWVIVVVGGVEVVGGRKPAGAAPERWRREDEVARVII
ncbi:hypothetical protein Tco_1565759, partial [Tanacetum coccineum]